MPEDHPHRGSGSWGRARIRSRARKPGHLKSAGSGELSAGAQSSLVRWEANSTKGCLVPQGDARPKISKR